MGIKEHVVADHLLGMSASLRGVHPSVRSGEGLLPLDKAAVGTILKKAVFPKSFRFLLGLFVSKTCSSH